MTVIKQTRARKDVIPKNCKETYLKCTAREYGLNLEFRLRAVKGGNYKVTSDSLAVIFFNDI